MFFFLRLKVVKIRYENWKYMNPEIKRKIHLFFHEESVMAFFLYKKGQRGQTNNLSFMVEMHTYHIHVTWM